MFSIEEDKLIFGAAINFNDICWVYPLKIAEIVGMGYDKYNNFLSCICLDISDVQNKMLKVGTPPEKLPSSALEYLLQQGMSSSIFLLELQEAFATFIREKVHFLFKTKEILIGEPDQRRVLNVKNFEDFQNIIRAQNGLSTPEPVPVDENPMARKFRLRREQLEAVKRKQRQNAGEEFSWSDAITTLVAFNVGVTYENVGKLTIYQFRQLMARAQAKYKYDLDIRMIAAGADPKKIKPKHWFGKLD